MRNILTLIPVEAFVAVVTFSLVSPVLLASDNKTTNESVYPPYHMTSGMMDGYGMGHGMMDGYRMDYPMGGGMGMGHGMMGARMWHFDSLDLTEEQQGKINKIRDETRKLHWGLMGETMDQQAALRDLHAAPKQDSAAIDKAYKKLGQLQQKMYETRVDAQKRMEAVLSKEQQEKLRKFSHRGW